MFSFFEKVDAKYEKLFFDFSINSISNQVINFNEFKGKTIAFGLLENESVQWDFSIEIFTRMNGGQQVGTQVDSPRSTHPQIRIRPL